MTTKVTKNYSAKDLIIILEEMADYVANSEMEDEELSAYFREIVGSGLFYNACGKIVKANADNVEVSIDY